MRLFASLSNEYFRYILFPDEANPLPSCFQASFQRFSVVVFFDSGRCFVLAKIQWHGLQGSSLHIRDGEAFYL